MCNLLMTPVLEVLYELEVYKGMTSETWQALLNLKPNCVAVNALRRWSVCDLRVLLLSQLNILFKLYNVHEQCDFYLLEQASHKISSRFQELCLQVTKWKHGAVLITYHRSLWRPQATYMIVWNSIIFINIHSNVRMFCLWS